MSGDALTLTTNRLLLRPLGLNDVARYHEILTHAEVRRYLLDDTIVSEEWVEAEVRRSLEYFQPRRYGTWAVTDLQRREIVGFCGFRFFFEEAEPQLFYGLDRPYWGQGFATEAAHAVVQYAFDVLGFNVVIAATDPPNVQSLRVLDRLGMTFDGELIREQQPTWYFSLRRDGIPSQ